MNRRRAEGRDADRVPEWFASAPKGTISQWSRDHRPWSGRDYPSSTLLCERAREERVAAMITVPIEDLVFIVCAIVGLVLLLITIVFDDIFGGILDAFHVGFDIGGTSLAPLLIAFVAMFGVGGLVATQLLNLHGGSAAVVGVIAGAIGVGIVFAIFSTFRRAEGRAPFSLQDLVGRTASVAVGIPAGRSGSVYVKAEGQTHEFSATSRTELASGTQVRVTGVAGNGLVVAAVEETPAAAGSGGSTIA
jgi:membrane protein implicated in regulation of membrane protease activity